MQREQWGGAVVSALWIAVLGSAPPPTVAQLSPGGNLALTVGSGVGCQYFSIQAAVDAARVQSGSDFIAIASNRSYSAQEIRIEDNNDPALAGDLTLIGGFDSCLGLQTGTPTRLSGAGGNARSVISHFGARALTLQNLEIVEGDAIAAAGGIESYGPGRLHLIDVALIGNRGVTGGGLSAVGTTSQRKAVQFSGQIRVSGNRASNDGGGIYALDAILAPGSASAALDISDNHAESGSGGGLYLLNSELRDGFGCGTAPMFAFNSASHTGGGLIVHARGAAANAFFGSKRPVCANRIEENVAGVAGGGAYVFADGGVDAPDGSLSSAELQLFDTRVSRNTAPDGAALGLLSLEIVGRNALAYANVSPPHVNPGPPPAPCVGAGSCTALVENAARVIPAGALSTGAVFAVDTQGEAQATLNLAQVTMIGNRGGTIFRVAGARARLNLADSLLAATQTVAEVLSAEGDADVDITRSTLAYGEIGANVILFGDRQFTLDRSIVVFPGKAVLRMRREANVASLLDVMVDAGQVAPPPGFFPDTILDLFPVTEPGFVASGAGNFRLLPTSPAIDFWSPNPSEGVGRDLDLQLRGVGASGRPNDLFDLGAFELHLRVFSDGFESPPSF